MENTGNILDRNFAYNIENLNKDQWEVFSQLITKENNTPFINDYDSIIRQISNGFKYIGFEDVSKKWVNYKTTIKDKRNALELFDQNYKVKLVAEGSKKFCDEVKENVFNPEKHYDNSKGSLFKISQEILKLNEWEFDLFKRLVRCRRKGQFNQDLQKMRNTIDLYEKEYKGIENIKK